MIHIRVQDFVFVKKNTKKLEIVTDITTNLMKESLITCMVVFEVLYMQLLNRVRLAMLLDTVNRHIPTYLLSRKAAKPLSSKLFAKE